MKNYFTSHPNEVGETYLEHAKQAFAIAYRLHLAAGIQLVHAVLPFVTPPSTCCVDGLITFLKNKRPSYRKKKKNDKIRKVG